MKIAKPLTPRFRACPGHVRGSRRPGPRRRRGRPDRAGQALRCEGQPAVDLHDRTAQGRDSHIAPRRQARLRRGQEGLHRRAAVHEDHGRRRQRGLGHGQLPMAAAGQGLPEHPPVAAAPGGAEHGLWPVRSAAGQDLPGARLRPGQHLVHQGRHRLDRLRPADGQGNRPRGARIHQLEARQAPGRRGRVLPLPRRPFRRRARRGRRGRCASAARSR